MTKVKFCGLFREEDITAANELAPDFVGFVFFKKSKRYVTPEKALELKQKLNPKIKAVGVFLDESIENIAEIANKKIIDIIQLHGKEDAKFIAELKKITSLPIIKAIQITSEVPAETKNFGADYILFDAGIGEGKTFDWEILKNVDYPYFLAGGLTVENIKTAMTKLNPYAVDVSSGIETNGVKDKTKMKMFMENIKN